MTPRRRRRRSAIAALPALLALACLSGGCRTRKDFCGDPVTVAQAFVERMEDGDTARAFELLSQAARQRLETEAREASKRLGQKVAAPDLLVPERSVLARAEWLALRSTLGDEAWVDVRPPEDVGAQARGPWGAQRLVREDGCWKVDLFHEAGSPPPAPDPADAPDAAADR